MIIHFWCQVWRPVLQYFGRYFWFSILLLMWKHLWHHHFPPLHNTKTWISLKRKKIFQKGKCHSSWLWKPFQKTSNYLLLQRHFKDTLLTDLLTTFWLTTFSKNNKLFQFYPLHVNMNNHPESLLLRYAFVPRKVGLFFCLLSAQKKWNGCCSQGD